MSQTSEVSKIGGYTRQHVKEHIYASMEVVQGTHTRTCWYHLHCLGCEAKCDLHFMTHGVLSSASVGKYAGMFCSLCKRLEQAEKSPVPDGQLPLSFGVSEEE